MSYDISTKNEQILDTSAKHIHMISCEDRLKTFIDWPHQLQQTPYSLACNGFYYSKQGDKVTCFYCGVSLKHWNSSDIIDIEHRKWSKDCYYIYMTLPVTK